MLNVYTPMTFLFMPYSDMFEAQNASFNELRERVYLAYVDHIVTIKLRTKKQTRGCQKGHKPVTAGYLRLIINGSKQKIVLLTLQLLLFTVIYE